MEASNKEIGRLMTELESLVTGEEACVRLILCGPAAIKPLRRFLLEGKPGVIFQPRACAVRALAGLEAWDVLIEYLGQDRKIADPQVRLGEKAVESEAARALAACPTEPVFRFLMGLAERELLVGLIDALAEFRRTESVPYFVRALEDDFYRPAAEKALEKLGLMARDALIASALDPQPNVSNEAPSSLRRRRSALALLGKMGVRPPFWEALSRLLQDNDDEVFVAAAKLGIAAASENDRTIMAARLLDLLTAVPWYLQEDVESLLVALKGECSAAVDEEIGRRTAQPDEIKAVDKRLWALLKLKRKLQGGT